MSWFPIVIWGTILYPFRGHSISSYINYYTTKDYQSHKVYYLGGSVYFDEVIRLLIVVQQCLDFSAGWHSIPAIPNALNIIRVRYHVHLMH